MPVALTSLMVKAEFDASSYIEGARQKEQADQRMIESGGQLDPGTVIRAVPGEWHPRMPERLDEEELRTG